MGNFLVLKGKDKAIWGLGQEKLLWTAGERWEKDRKTSAIIMVTNNTINVIIMTYAKIKLTKTEYTESLSK